MQLNQFFFFRSKWAAASNFMHNARSKLTLRLNSRDIGLFLVYWQCLLFQWPKCVAHAKAYFCRVAMIRRLNSNEIRLRACDFFSRSCLFAFQFSGLHVLNLSVNTLHNCTWNCTKPNMIRLDILWANRRRRSLSHIKNSYFDCVSVRLSGCSVTILETDRTNNNKKILLWLL